MVNSKDLAEIVAKEIEGVQNRYNELINSEYLKNLLENRKNRSK